MNLTKEEIITKFCELQTVVNSHLGHKHAADCFCGKSKFERDDYRNEGEAFKFIQEAVMEKMGRKVHSK